MEHMSNLAGLGHTVIASIHQPRSAIWEMFDKVTRPDRFYPTSFLAARLLQIVPGPLDLCRTSANFPSSRLLQRCGSSYRRLVPLSVAQETCDKAHV